MVFILLLIVLIAGGYWVSKDVSDDLSEQGKRDQEDLTSFYNSKEDGEPAQPVKRKPGRPRKVA